MATSRQFQHVETSKPRTYITTNLAQRPLARQPTPTPQPTPNPDAPIRKSDRDENGNPGWWSRLKFDSPRYGVQPKLNTGEPQEQQEQEADRPNQSADQPETASPWATRSALPMPHLQRQERDITPMPEQARAWLRSRSSIARSSVSPQPQPAFEPNIQAQSDPVPYRRPAWWDRLTFDPQRPSTVQAKLTVGAPNDQYEQEADAVATQVLAMPEPTQQPNVQQQTIDPPNEEEEAVQTKPIAHTITPLLQREAVLEAEEEEIQPKLLGTAAIQRDAIPEDEEVQAKPLAQPLDQRIAGTLQRDVMPEEEDALQAKPLGNAVLQREAMPEEEETVQPKRLQRFTDGSLQANSNLETQLNSSRGGGSPLSDDVRSFMEPRFGADLSQVRVHTGASAVQMNKDLSAQAFTHKQDIYFGAGKAPGKNDLTAHELTHVVQQTEAVRQKPDGTQAEPAPKSVDADSRTANSEDSQDVESIVNQIVNALQIDPNDQSGRIKQLVARLNPSTRQAVLTQLQTRLAPEQQQSLQTILAEPAPAPTELPPDQMAPNEGSTLEEQHHGSAGSSQTTEQKLSNQTPTDSSQPAPENAQEREPGANASDAPGRQGATGDQTSSSSPGKNGAGVATEQANAQQAAIPRNGSRQGSAEQDASNSRKGQATTAKTGSASSSGNSSLAQADNEAASSEPRSSSSSPGSQASGRGAATSSAGNQARSPNQATIAGQPLQSSEVQASSARSQSTQALLEQVATTANSARQRFTDRITQGTEAIAASIQQQQAFLIAAGEQQTGAIQALFANAHAQVGEIITSAQTQLQTEATSHLATLQQGHTATLGQVATTFSSGQERVQTLGNTYADRSLQTADESAQQVQTRIQGMAQESRAIGQEKAQVGGSTPEVAQAKAKAANEIASDTATKITSGVSDAMRDLRATGPETARGFREQGQEAARQVGAGQAEVVNQLNTANQQTSAGIQQAVIQGSQALSNLNSQLTAQLASLEQTIRNQLQTEIAQKSQEIATAGQQAIMTFQEQGQQAIAAGDEHLAQFNQQLAGMNIDPALAAEVTGEIVGQVNGAYDNLIATTDGAFQQADSALTQAGTEVITAVNGVSTNAAGQIQSFLGQAQGQVTQQVGTISAQLGTTVTQANATGSTMVNKVATSLNGQIGQIDGGFGQGLDQYRSALNEQVTSAEGKAHEPRESLPSRISQGQQRAEERAQHSLFNNPLAWLGDQLSDLWGMLSDPGFWVGLLVGVALALVVVAAVAAAPFTGGASIAIATIAGMALAGGLAAAAGTIVSNITDHSFSNLFSGKLDWSRWSENLGASILIGALFGAALAGAEMLGAGLVGLSIAAGVFTVITNVATGQLWDKNLLASMLLLGVLGKLFSLARRGGAHGEEPIPQPGNEPIPQPGEEPVPQPRNEPVSQFRPELQAEIDNIRANNGHGGKPISGRRNIAYADIDITGVPGERLIGVSGVQDPPGTVGIPKDNQGNPVRSFDPEGTGANARLFDSEVKILEAFAARHPDGSNVTGTIHLVSERAPCTSCEGVIRDFRSKYPNIDLQVSYTRE